jgi:hypothetical protein
MDDLVTSIRQGFAKQAGCIFKQGTAAAGLGDVERGLNIAMGKKIHSLNLDPSSSMNRWLSRLATADGQLYHANKLPKIKGVLPSDIEENYNRMGQTARGRAETAKKIGYGGAGLLGGGLLAYGMGNARGQGSESKFLGQAGNQYLRNASLFKRLQLALGTVFSPSTVGNQIQDTLQ